MRRLVLASVTLLLAVMVAVAAFRLGAAVPHHTSSDAPATSQAPPAQPSGRPPAGPSHSAPAWTQAAAMFVKAFLDRSPTRTYRLRAAASPRLAALLARTDPAKIPTARPVGAPSVARESDGTNQTGQTMTVVQQLSDGSAFAFDLVPDPSRASGWVVTSVRPGEQ